MVRRAVGYHRYDTAEDLVVLNDIYAMLRWQTNYVCPQQTLVEKTREGAKVTKRYDTAATPYQRVLADDRVPQKIKTGLGREYRQLNPAQIRRDILALGDQLLELVSTRRQLPRQPVQPPTATRAS